MHFTVPERLCEIQTTTRQLARQSYSRFTYTPSTYNNTHVGTRIYSFNILFEIHGYT